MAGAKTAEMPNMAKPIGRLAGGSLVRMMLKASGIIVPPDRPWPMRKAVMLARSHACPQRTEKMRNSTTLVRKKRRSPKTCASQPESGIMTISGSR